MHLCVSPSRVAAWVVVNAGIAMGTRTSACPRPSQSCSGASAAFREGSVTTVPTEAAITKAMASH